MTKLRPATYLPGQFHLLARAFEQATAALSQREASPSIKACLADKILAAVAAGEIDPDRVSVVALEALRHCLRGCQGCDHANPPARSDRRRPPVDATFVRNDAGS
jgi:hypothetical protein